MSLKINTRGHCFIPIHKNNWDASVKLLNQNMDESLRTFIIACVLRSGKSQLPADRDKHLDVNGRYTYPER